MAEDEGRLRTEERQVLKQLAQQENLEGQRAQAVLALDHGRTQTETAEETGLTASQVRYIQKKFEEQRLLAFPDALGMLPADAPAEQRQGTWTAVAPAAETRKRLDIVLADIDGLIKELRTRLPAAGEYDYSPAQMLALVRDSAARYAPDVQLQMLQPFEDMTEEDLLDIETWKGIAYMIGYSAHFQANKAREQLNATLPEPIRPDSMTRTLRDGMEQFAPQIVKDIAASLEGATVEDLLDPDTWKGLAYMISYSAQFQLGQARVILNEELPDPVKPDTLLAALKDGYGRYAPDVVKQIVANFEEATLEDLLDPETWKGVWYLLNYSLQFQAEKLGLSAAEDTVEAR